MAGTGRGVMQGGVGLGFISGLYRREAVLSDQCPGRSLSSEASLCMSTGTASCPCTPMGLPTPLVSHPHFFRCPALLLPTLRLGIRSLANASWGPRRWGCPVAFSQAVTSPVRMTGRLGQGHRRHRLKAFLSHRKRRVKSGKRQPADEPASASGLETEFAGTLGGVQCFPDSTLK